MLSQRIHSFVFGLTLPLAAARLILTRPTLMALSLIPVAITLTLYFYLIRTLQDAAQSRVLEFFTAHGWDAQGWALGLVLLLTKVLLLLVSALTFSFVASITSSPFNDFLAERTEPWTTPPLPSPPQTSVAGKVRILIIDLAKTVAATGASLVALLFSWVPFLNLAAFALAFLLVAFQYLSYPQTRRGIGVLAGVRYLWSHAYACAGFGATLSVLFAIPVLSALCVPLAVVGGTLLFARAEAGRARLLPPLR